MESGRVWNKVYDLAYDATIGLVKLYRKKTLELVKITAASVYLQGLRVARKHLLLVFCAIFAAMLSAVAVVVVPVALVMIAPWSTGVKVVWIAALGLVDTGIIFVCLKSVFSEEKWMKASGFQELLDSINTDSR